MREIKFRGREVIGNQRKLGGWVFGDLVHYCGGYERTVDDEITPVVTEICIECADCLINVAPSTVGQFIGLKDHKGREIYEGDIVKVMSYGEESFHVVKYMIDLDYPAFDLEPAMDGDFNSLSYCMIDIDTKITVIGNIHDNPELLRLTKNGGLKK